MPVHFRVPHLQQLQQLVEVQESAWVLIDSSNGNKLSGNSAVGVHGNLYADLKDILETWRLRTLNQWDCVSIWYDFRV
ncbi:putative transcription-associated protein [Medicago truncatula]|uniref:Putative transcription-associated protein n=1 Tax=Medicago truncatula TaxID=3880 RepID=A0A396HRZ8_MEDTR|nr:putative transcription-associated protein [Medicago truncatula]